MSDFSNERPPIFPVFLLIDVSYSMAGDPIEAVNSALPELKKMIENDPTVGEIARVAIISFAAQARLVLELEDLQYVNMPVLECEGGTNFASAFSTAKDEIENQIRRYGSGTTYYSPVVFFMSDGYHLPEFGSWEPALQGLKDQNWNFRPQIVAFGFGEALGETLKEIATTHAFVARDGGDPVEQVREIMRSLIGSVKTASRSLAAGKEQAEFTKPDDTMFMTLNKQTI